MPSQEKNEQDLQKVRFEDSDFRKSSSCLMRRVCVKVAHKEGAVAVRDSKDASKMTLLFNEEEWKGFVEGVKAGEFDL